MQVDYGGEMETIYFAGGCLWGVEYFMKNLPGVKATEAGRANGKTDSLDGPYDGYAECVKVVFDDTAVTVQKLMNFFFEIIDPYSVNRQGRDKGLKYRTGVYSRKEELLEKAKAFIEGRSDREKIKVEVLPLTRYVKSREEHQNHLERFPEDEYLCSIPRDILNKYRK